MVNKAITSEQVFVNSVSILVFASINLGDLGQRESVLNDYEISVIPCCMDAPIAQIKVAKTNDLMLETIVPLIY